MSFLRHIRACNAHDLAGFRSFHVGDIRVGWVRHALADRLARLGDVFQVMPDRVMLAPDLQGFDDRSAAMAHAVGRLVEDGVMPTPRRELYPVLTRWGAPPLLAIDRSAVAYFGIAAYGVHVNGLVRLPDGDGDDGPGGGIELWVAKRAQDRIVEPGKLDNLIAGGQPMGLSLAQNLVKEAREEANIGPDLIGRAVPVGAVSYLMETSAGLKPDTLFLYDLEVPSDFVPENTDGEVEAFMRWPLDKVAASVRDTDAWKFNCNLVVTDLLIRHGWLKPDDDDYLDIVNGLRR